MTQVVHKHVLELKDNQIVTIDSFFTILDCQIQGSEICFWYIVDDQTGLKQTLNFQIKGTGQQIAQGYFYLSTVQVNEFVWHIFYNYNKQ